MISLLFIAYVGENAGLSFVGPAFAQTGSGSGTNPVATVGTCNNYIYLNAFSYSVNINDGAAGFSGGTNYDSGTVYSGYQTVQASDFSTCGVTNVTIKYQTGPAPGNITASLDFTYTYLGVGYEFVGNASTSIATYSITTIPAPTVTAISPNSGPTAGGTSVTITGTHFTGPISVTIGGALATTFTLVSATSITATTPSGTAGTASVLVTTPGGTNSANTLYTYVAAPTVTAISPTSGPTTGGTAVTITGTNFTGATSVTIGGAAATSVVVVNPTTITANTPAGAAGTASVLVTTAGGTNAANSLYTYVAAPTVTAISPTSGPTAGGTSVTITGTNFTGATAVTIGGAAATSVVVVNPTTITANTPAGAAGTASVLVTTAGGTNTSNTLYTYVAAPTVTAISPTSGPTGGGTSVTITGTNFTGATAVTIGGAAATGVVVVNPTTITATTPSGTAGTASVLVTTPGGTNAANTLYTYVTPAPTVTGISPTSGPTAGGTSVTITGTGFTGATAVTIGGAAATGVTVVSSTSITATTPAGSAGTASVLVTTPGGTNSANTLYTYLNPTPGVTSINPNTGPTTGGTSVTISGVNFTGASAVRFGNSNATSFTVISATQISAIAPPGALGIVDVTVITPSGTSAVSPADQFSYAVPTDSVNLRKLQATVTPMAAQVWGQATVSAMQSATSEGFAGGGALVTRSGNGVRFNFSADADDQQQPSDSGTLRGRAVGIGPVANSDPFSSAYGSFGSNAQGLAPGSRAPLTDAGSANSRTDDAFAALGYGGPVKAPALRVTEPKEWLGWAEISGATLDRWTAPATVGAAAATSSIYGDQVNVIAGLTRVLTPNFLVGVLAGWETFDFRSDAIQGRLTGDGWTTGAYAGWKLSSTIHLDAGVAYSGIGFNGSAGTASGSFSGNRLLVTGGVTGDYKAYGFLLQPSANVFALWEHENAYTDSLGTAQAGREFSTGRASTGLKVAYPFSWTDTIKLAPYAGIYGDYYFNTDNVTLTGVGALPVAPVFAGGSARADLGIAAQFASGGQLTVGGERSGIGGNFSLWTYRARASIPFTAQ